MVNSEEIIGTLCNSLDEVSQTTDVVINCFTYINHCTKKGIYLHPKNEIGKRISQRVWIIKFCQQLCVLRYRRGFCIVCMFVYNS